METADERQSAFRKDLEELLKKHGAEIYIDDFDKRPYITSYRISVSMQSEYSDTECVKDYCEFEL